MSKQKVIEKTRIYVYQNPYKPRECMYNVFHNVTKVEALEDREVVHTDDGKKHNVFREFIQVRTEPADQPVQ